MQNPNMNSTNISLAGTQVEPMLLPALNSLAPGRFQFNFRKVIFKLTLVNGGWGISYEIALTWMPQDFVDDKSTLVQVMAWCRQATSHYLSQCWPRSMSPYGILGPNELIILVNDWHIILTHWPLAGVAVILKVWFSNSLYRIVAWALAM